MPEKCGLYFGEACVEIGEACPLEQMDEEGDTDAWVLKICNNCFYNKGCGDCFLAGTKHCIKYQKKSSGESEKRR